MAEKFARISEQWQPKIVAELNGQLVKVQGTFPWHYHDDVEEMFLVWRGRLRVEFRDRIVELGPGELVVVPRGVEHRTAADEEAEVILFEPSGVLNTGNVIDEKFTAPWREDLSRPILPKLVPITSATVSAILAGTECVIFKGRSHDEPCPDRQ
jgi:mannose-6-phosphate isomerase-like protein (cupin superfamily)